jgi:hypothetical protein
MWQQKYFAAASTDALKLLIDLKGCMDLSMLMSSATFVQDATTVLPVPPCKKIGEQLYPEGYESIMTCGSILAVLLSIASYVFASASQDTKKAS